MRSPGALLKTLAPAGLAAVLSLAASAAWAEPAWLLDPGASILTYQSIKKNTIVETNTIRNISGRIEPDGTAKVEFDLDSVDTGVDLRNVRMRFLFFETYKFPIATVLLKVNKADFAELATKRRMTVPLTFTLNLHGVDKELKSDAIVTMLTDSSVSIASKAPVIVKVEDYGLLPNIDKLQQAANVTNIVPTASVTYDFVFNAEGSTPPAAAVTAADTTTTAKPEDATVQQAAAVGPVATDASKSAFTEEECLNRFQVLSRTGAIYFRTGSAQLDPASRPVLNEVVDVVGKCPKLKVEVSGHTDADGSDNANQLLSERRAGAVAQFIRSAGIPEVQLSSVGFGETKPVAANDTPEHKALNRRIEFSATEMTN
jgi:outer membrane protein OmpA-like peptidoglycan-associated protein